MMVIHGLQINLFCWTNLVAAAIPVLHLLIMTL